MDDYPVVIVGGGPVGMMLALELRLGGVQPLVLERLTEPAGADRAGALHARTLEMLDIRGMLGRFLSGTNVAKGLPLAGMFRIGLDFGLLDTRHHYSAMVPQSRTEELLACYAREGTPVEVRRGHDVTGLSQDSDGVVVEVAGPDGRYDVRASYVVGCDGGRSTVRRLAGFSFEGQDASVAALIGYVTTPERDIPPRWERTPGGILVLAFPPEGGIGRVVVVEYDRPPWERSEPVTLTELGEAVERVRGKALTLTEPVQWMSRFSDASRQAAHYRVGRVLLAGDAAHIHFPIGGQGLNTGLQDAFNLGWKLAAEVSGRASPGLLDTYHAERHPVGARVLLNTRAQLALMRPDDRHTTPLRDLVTELMAYDDVNRHFGAMITGTEVRYDLSDEAWPGVTPTAGAAAAALAPHPGDVAACQAWQGRFAGHLSVATCDGIVHIASRLHHGGGLFIEFGEYPDLRTHAACWRGRVTTLSGTPVAGPRGAATDPRLRDAELPLAMLVRPDGYCAWAGGPGYVAARFRAALERWFGGPTDH